MKNALYILIGFFLLPLVGASQKRAVPNVFALDAKALQAAKSGVSKKSAVVMPALKKLIKDADAALQFGPVSVVDKKNIPPSGDKHDYMSLAPYHWPDPAKADGLPYIRKDGQTNPEVLDYKDKEYMPKLCKEVSNLSLAWYFTEERKYAVHAARLLRVWFLDSATKMNPNLNFAQAIRGVNTGRGAGLIDTRHFIKLIDAVGILQGSKEWTAADQKAMQQWFAAFLDWMQTSEIGKDEMAAKNNHGIWYDAQRLSMALFTGNMQLANQIVMHARTRLDAQLDASGSFPREMERTISLHYTVFAMTAFFTVATMAEKTDTDLWNYTGPSGASLKKAFDHAYPYITKKKDWHGQQIKAFGYEDGYQLLFDASKKFGCTSCKDDVRYVAGEKYPTLLNHLLY